MQTTNCFSSATLIFGTQIMYCCEVKGRKRQTDSFEDERQFTYPSPPPSCFSTIQLFRSFSIFGFSHHKDRELMYSTTKLRDSTSERGTLIRSLLYYRDAFNFPLACFYFSSTTPTAPRSTRVGITKIFN